MIDSFSAPPSPPSVTERGGPRVYASRDSSLRGIALNLPLRLFRSFDGIPPVLCSSFACGTALHHFILLYELMCSSFGPTPPTPAEQR
jgi:hypothetical protein